jgi:diphthamide synthase (EF-2-diphthine--ammonia ligase)
MALPEVTARVDESRSFAGRAFDRELLADLPPDVDPCGENGEFHTFTHTGPIFPNPIPCSRGQIVERDGMIFCDLIPELERTT